jgi:hypothetical protein
MAKSFKATVDICVVMLAETFRRVASDPMLNAYRIGLEGLTPEQVELASHRALKESKFMPSPAELRELAGEMRIEDRAQVAWLAFDAALSRHSYYRTLTFDDVVINAVVRSMGGLAVVIETPADEYTGNFRARFLRAYEGLARSRLGSDQCGPLLGYHDKTNEASSAPVVIHTGLPPLPTVPRIADEQGRSVKGIDFDRGSLLKRATA